MQLVFPFFRRDPRIPHAARLAATVLAGLGLAGCGGNNERAPDLSAPNIAGADLVVAEVAGRPITAGEVCHKIRIQYPDMPQTGGGLGRQVGQTVQESVLEHCLTRLAEQRHYDREPDYLRTLYLSRNYILSQTAIGLAIDRPSQASPAEIDSFYAANKERYRYTAQAWWQHILVGSEAEARRIRNELVAGSDFAKLADKYSLDKSSAKRGGKMPAHPRGPQVAPLGNLPELDAAIFALEAGELSQPIHTSKGWHIVRLEAKRAERQRTLDEVRQDVAAKISTPRRTDRYDFVIDSLKKAYEVVVHKDVLEQFYRLQMDDAELFEAAQKSRDAEERVRFFEEIVRRFPQSARRPEALFMIGFECMEQLADRTRAQEALERFLKEYPAHEMAASAKSLLDEIRSGAPASGGVPQGILSDTSVTK